MAVWLIRAGAHGEHEQKFVAESRVYVTWDGLDLNLSKLTERSELATAMLQRYPGTKARSIGNWVGQVWPFAHLIKKGDLVVVPLKTSRTIQIGEVTSDYQFEVGPDPYFHWRAVKWVGEALPRDRFPPDLLHSFNALMTICRIHRNNAEARLEAMRGNGWKPETVASAVGATISADSDESEASAETDLEEAARDQIAALILARFKGHGLARLVDGVLRAQGYVTYQSPEGPDGGVDILAGAGPLGFGSPRLCVEVKSGSSPIDRPTVDKLLGAVSKFHADEGLFVSWSGFKPNVQRELAGSFFRIRLWSQEDLLKAVFDTYERLDEELKAELPLKRVWTVAMQDDE